MKTLGVDDILNRVSAAVGLGETQGPFSSDDKHFSQLRSLLQDSGEELAQMFDWEHLKVEYTFTTVADTEEYTLPEDFDRMVPGTHWDRANDLPIGGPLTSQDWQYLKGRDLVSSTIYASYRQRNGKLFIFPGQAGFDITLEYVSKNWVDQNGTRADVISSGGDTVLFDSSLILSYLRAKFYEAKGLATMRPDAVARNFYEGRKSRDARMDILNVGGPNRQFPYLDALRNTPDTGYGK